MHFDHTTLNRAVVVDEQFLNRVRAADFPIPRSATECLAAGLDKQTAIALFDSQIKSRHLDLIARELKEQGVSYYTIGSSGHEGNVVFGEVFPTTDMAFLHYRSGAFYLQRSKQVDHYDGVRDILLSLFAAAEEPISGGRHKVFGSVALNIPPQTSTIASHLPKSLGAAFSITRAKELGLSGRLAHDSLVICSFGDASMNHASAQATLNAAAWLTRQSYPLPLVFICEDNGIGISVPTPHDWIASCIKARPNLHYLDCDGLNLADCFLKAKEAAYWARVKKQVVFLHMRCIRLLGHAGSDIELQYRTLEAIESIEADDPLLHTARLLYQQAWMSLEEMISLYEHNRALIKAKAMSLMQLPGLSSKNRVMSSICPNQRSLPACAMPDESGRKAVYGEQYEQLSLKRNLCQHINFALTDLMIQYPHAVVFGEDVGQKGGVYRVTAGLQARFGRRRVFDTILDETTILGTAIGMAHNGFIPIPEIQFLAYLHNAEDQLRGEAATLSFFSNGQYQNPMVIRIPALAYQKGFGGHFHNDNSIAILRDLPGVIVVCPSNGPDAVKLLRTCMALAYQKGRVVVFLEPIALYMTKDLHEAQDNAWLFHYPPIADSIPLGVPGVYGKGETVILTYANGYYLSRQAGRVLQEQYGISVKIVDLRWLSPLPKTAILREVASAKHVLIVDEGRRSGSLSEGLMTLLMERASSRLKIQRLTGEDCFIPLGNAWRYLLPSRDDIIEAVRRLAHPA